MMAGREMTIGTEPIDHNLSEDFCHDSVYYSSTVHPRILPPARNSG